MSGETAASRSAFAPRVPVSALARPHRRVNPRSATRILLGTRMPKRKGKSGASVQPTHTTSDLDLGVLKVHRTWMANWARFTEEAFDDGRGTGAPMSPDQNAQRLAMPT